MGSLFRACLGFVAAVLICVQVAAQQPTESISDAEIEAAIALGQGKARLDPYSLSGFMVGSKGFVLTPFLRIASAARAASKKYQPFTKADVSPELRSPLIDVVVPAYDLSQINRGPGFVNVETVLIMPKGSEDPAAAIRPVETLDDVSVLQNAFGMKIETKGLIARFPRSAFAEGREIVIVYEGRLGAGRQEFRGEFKQKDLLKWR